MSNCDEIQRVGYILWVTQVYGWISSHHPKDIGPAVPLRYRTKRVSPLLTFLGICARDTGKYNKVPKHFLENRNKSIHWWTKAVYIV